MYFRSINFKLMTDMKRLITAAAAAVLLISPAVVSAQEHMLEVKRYSDYAKDYLTITDAG